MRPQDYKSKITRPRGEAVLMVLLSHIWEREDRAFLYDQLSDPFLWPAVWPFLYDQQSDPFYMTSSLTLFLWPAVWPFFMTSSLSLFVWPTVWPFLYDQQSDPFCMTSSLTLFVWPAVCPFLYDQQSVPFCMTSSLSLFVWPAVIPCLFDYPPPHSHSSLSLCQVAGLMASWSPGITALLLWSCSSDRILLSSCALVALRLWFHSIRDLVILTWSKLFSTKNCQTEQV